MDTVTHALSGWLMSRTIPTERWGSEAKTGKIALIAGSVLPDADIVPSLLGSDFYVRFHQGLSHSLVGAAASSFLFSLLLYRFGKWKEFRKLLSLTLVAQLSHIALDLLNSYGTQVFLPFSDHRFSFDLVFVVDLAFTGIVVSGLLLSRRRPAPARAACVALAAYVAIAAFLHGETERVVKEMAAKEGIHVSAVYALPVPGTLSISKPAIGLKRVLPLPAGPFSWNGFVDDGKNYIRARVAPLSGTVEWKERIPRAKDAPELRKMLDVPDVRTYLKFARFPVVQEASGSAGAVLTLSDLRYRGIPNWPALLLRIIERPGDSPQAKWGGGA